MHCWWISEPDACNKDINNAEEETHSTADKKTQVPYTSKLTKVHVYSIFQKTGIATFLFQDNEK